MLSGAVFPYGEAQAMMQRGSPLRMRRARKAICSLTYRPIFNLIKTQRVLKWYPPTTNGYKYVDLRRTTYEQIFPSSSPFVSSLANVVGRRKIHNVNETKSLITHTASRRSERSGAKQIDCEHIRIRLCCCCFWIGKSAPRWVAKSGTTAA